MRLWGLASVMLALVARASAGAPEAGLVGRWAGAVDTHGGPLPFEVSFEAGAGRLSGRISIPVQGVADRALAGISVVGEVVAFELRGVPGQPRFTGRLDGDGATIRGELTQSGRSLPFTLRRLAGAPPEPALKPPPAPPPPPAAVAEPVAPAEEAPPPPPTGPAPTVTPTATSPSTQPRVEPVPPTPVPPPAPPPTATPLPPAPQTVRFAGRWNGVIEVPGRPVAITLDLFVNADGMLSGEISIPEQAEHDLPLAGFEVRGAEVGFELPGRRGAPVFRGRLTEAGDAIVGELTQEGLTFPFLLHRN